MKSRGTLATVLALAILAAPLAKAQNGGNGNGNGNGNNQNTGGYSGGNNGNGNAPGNTGPGNQGNTSPNGNAGGTQGSANGGNNNGNGNGGNNNNTGGYSGGNNGNGTAPGNTGPGNQGNSGPNGNAGGTQGSSNGGTQGNGNGGSNGGNNGNGQGGTNGNNGNGQGGTNGNNGNGQGGTNGNNGNGQGGTHGNNGNGQGGSQGNGHGGSAGGCTQGGSTGGATVGGSTGGAQTGGQSTGGQQTGGQSTGGASTGGQSTGGSTGGQSSSGGSTGGEATGGTSGGVENKKASVNVRVLPLAFGNYDIANKMVNLTVDARAASAVNIPVALDVCEKGYRVSQLRAWDAALGVAPQLFLENVSGIAAATTAVIGIAPKNGKTVQFERLRPCGISEGKIDLLPKLKLPYTLEDLASYQVGESVTWEALGGMVYSAGLSAYGVYAGGSVTAEGGFKTAVEKLGQDKVAVSVTKLKIRKASLFTGYAVVNLNTSTNKQLNDGFSYIFDFNGGDAAVDAYTALVSGNAQPAQELAAKGAWTGVSHIDSTKGQVNTKKRGMTIGIPMVAIANWDSGKTIGHSETTVNADKSQTELNYGIYFKEQTSRLFHQHRNFVRTFYSGQAELKNKNGEVVKSEQKATFQWKYENDKVNSKLFKRVVSRLQRDIGLTSVFNPFIDARGKEKLGFVRLEASVEIPQAFTKKLIALAQENQFLSNNQNGIVAKYFAKGDADDLCVTDDEEMVEDCRASLEAETSKALKNINGILLNLGKASDAKAFVALQAKMGKEVLKNQFVLSSVLAADNKCEIAYSLKLEGERVSQINKKVAANPACRK